jgi:hypothetical protein
MAMKSKYNFSNQCYNDIVKLIIDLIPMKHNMPKDFYQSKKIVSGIRRVVDAMGTSSRCWILAATSSTLHTSLAPGSGTMDAANTVRTSSRRLADAVGNTVDAVRTSGRRVRSGMICIFSNYRLRIKKIQYHTSLVKYRFLRPYSVKSRIYVVYDHLTCLYLCLGGFGLTT